MTIHATTVLIGAHAVLIRGQAGAGKSHLALRLLTRADERGLFARLVADDRTDVAAVNGRLVARPADALAGLIEVRSLGIRRLAHEQAAVVSLVVDLEDEGSQRLPAEAARTTEIAGVTLPRLALPPDVDPLPAVMAALFTRER